MRYFIIGDEDAVLGFGMVGVKGAVVDDAGEAETTLKGCFEGGDVGIVLITERIAELIRPVVDRFIFTQNFPLIVEIPDRLGRLPGKAGLREMVNEAIGIKL
jgi:V/A-type H+-transporting ATPase subunit F